MQLLLILALLLYGGKPDAKNLLCEMRPVLENLGGDEIKEALKGADEISEVLSAVQTFADSLNSPSEGNTATPQNNAYADRVDPAIAFPLAPISGIADKDITYSLSKYISRQEQI